MTTESVSSRTDDTGLFLPADGLSLLGESPGDGYAGRRFLVRRSDGQVIQLPLLLYLIMAAIAEGGVDGGWSAGQVGTRVETASGQGLSADNVRYLVEAKLPPLGLIPARGAGRPDERPRPVPPHRASLRSKRKTGGAPRHHRGRRWVLLLGGGAVLVSIATAAPIMAGTGNREPGGTGSPSPSPLPSAAAASRAQAAAWVAQQVSPDAAVSCDPAMCAQLQRDQFPAARLKRLPPGASVLPASGLVVATPAIRSQFGPRLAAAYAPQVIASFGSGAARVDIRMIAPAGARAFRTQLAAKQSALALAGRQLLSNTNIQAGASARAALWGGQVDARLLTVLSLLSAQMPVRLMGFDGAPGADPGVPLRGAEIGVTSSAARSAVVALLDAQRRPYRPTVTDMAYSGRSVVILRFDAPASLDMSQP